MHIPVMAGLFAAKTRRLRIETDHESTASVADPRGRRLASDATRGEIHLRRLTPADAHHMTDLLERLSPQSRYLRYFRLVSSLAPADIARFVVVSPGHLAIGAFDRGVLVGAAQYFRSACTTHAEVAVEVADSHHRRRVGARLVHELARLAADEGITHFTATVLAENRPVLGLMRQSGWEIATTLDGAYADIVVTLPPQLVGATARCEERERDRPRHLIPALAGPVVST